MSHRLKISDELSAIDAAGRPVEVEDARGRVYVVLTEEEFRRHVYDDGDVDPADTYPLIDAAFGGPEGWDAPGMDAYDLESGDS
jgi:hypothetical protein